MDGEMRKSLAPTGDGTPDDPAYREFLYWPLPWSLHHEPHITIFSAKTLAGSTSLVQAQLKSTTQ